jgi:serine/threonine-protein kinase
VTGSSPIPSKPEAGGFQLPSELLSRARRRLGRLALLLSLVFTLVALLGIGLWLSDTVEVGSAIRNGVGGGLGLAFAMAVFWATRSSRVGHTAALDFGLLFEVFLCFVVCLGVFQGSYAQSGELPELTWVIGLIILFPLVIPSPPARTLGVSIAAAATAPLALLILTRWGTVEAEPFDYFRVSIHPTLSVVIAFFASRVVYGMSQDVARAWKVGSYRLETLLGEGGMGEVWRARHRLLARPAAVKLIRPEVLRHSAPSESRHETIRRFEREAQVTARLESPHTVSLYHFGTSDDGSLYYVMELLDGLDLETWVRTYGPLEPDRAVRMLLQVCHSLKEAHRAQLVHRDIKPANIFACRYGEDVDFVKVLDFGLVGPHPEAGGKKSTITGQIFVGGTPAYLPPEVAAGENMDHRGDIYSLGCVAYFLLTGRCVFEHDNPVDMVRAHHTEKPVPPSEVSELDIPECLERVVMGCLEKNPDDRPEDAGVLAQLLRACELVTDRTYESAERWWERHRPRQPDDLAETIV